MVKLHPPLRSSIFPVTISQSTASSTSSPLSLPPSVFCLDTPIQLFCFSRSRRGRSLHHSPLLPTHTPHSPPTHSPHTPTTHLPRPLILPPRSLILPTPQEHTLPTHTPHSPSTHTPHSPSTLTPHSPPTHTSLVDLEKPCEQQLGLGAQKLCAGASVPLPTAVGATHVLERPATQTLHRQAPNGRRRRGVSAVASNFWTLESNTHW